MILQDEATDVSVLAATFASRVQLAKLTEDEAAAQARTEWQRTIKWVQSSSQQVGAFLWFCDEFDLEPDAVRRAIKEKRK